MCDSGICRNVCGKVRILEKLWVNGVTPSKTVVKLVFFCVFFFSILFFSIFCFSAFCFSAFCFSLFCFRVFCFKKTKNHCHDYESCVFDKNIDIHGGNVLQCARNVGDCAASINRVNPEVIGSS